MQILCVLDSPYSWESGIWFHRNHLPSIALQERGHGVKFMSVGGTTPKELMEYPDTVIFGRTYHPSSNPLALMREFKNMGKRVLYDLDDDFWCYSEDTEVLTTNGWKNIANVEKGERVYSYSLEKDCVEEIINNETIIKDYSGEMIRFVGESIDILTTPNHKMLAALSKGANVYGNFELINASELVGKHFRLKKDARWNGKKPKNWKIILNGREKEIPIELFLRFLGYYISEGSCGVKNVTITQDKNSKYYSEMIKTAEDIASFLGLSAKIYSERNIVICGKDFRDYIKKLVPGNAVQKHIPKEVLELSPELLLNLYNGLIQGDGSNSYGLYYTSSPYLRDDFILLVNKLGWSGRAIEDNRVGRKIFGGRSKTKHINYCISILKDKNQPRFNHHKEWGATVRKEEYNGRIVCLGLERNHIMLVRRNGLSVWSGNSVNPDNPSVLVSNAYKDQYEDFIRESDACITPSPILAEKMKKLVKGKKVFICNNMINTEFYTPRPNDKDELIVGYMGAASHWEDLKIIGDVIPDLQRKYKFLFVLYGMTGNPLEGEMYKYTRILWQGLQPEKAAYLKGALDWYKKIKGIDMVHIPFYPPELHPYKLRECDFDIGIAPLYDCEFNRGKSNIKFYEYAAVNTVTLASDVEPYKREVNYRAKNTYKDWYNKLEKLITDKPFRDKILKEQREWVLNNRTTRQVGLEWEMACQKEFGLPVLNQRGWKPYDAKRI